MVNEKLGADQGLKKTEEYKERKAGGENTLQDAHIKKAVKGTAEVNAGQRAMQHKERKAGAENAAGSAQLKWKKQTAETNAQMGDGSVKTASHGSGGGSGKVATQDIDIKGQKNAGEVKAGQQDANKKLKKQTDQASPK